MNSIVLFCLFTPVFSNSSTPTPTPPPNPPPNRPPSHSSSSFQPFNFQPHMVAHAFQQLLQGQTPNFNHEQLMQQHFLNKMPPSADPNNGGSNSHSACSSPVPNMMDEQPQPPPIPIQILVNKPAELIKPDSNAMFMRVWDRGTNSCSRTDLHFRYLPGAKYLKLKEEQSMHLQQQKLSKEATSRVATPSSPALNMNSQNVKQPVGKEGLKCSSPFNSYKSKEATEKASFKEINENGKSFLPPLPSKDNGILKHFKILETLQMPLSSH